MTVRISKITATFTFDRENLPAVLSLAAERDEYLVSLDRAVAVGKSRAGREVRVEIQGEYVALTATLDGSQVFAAHLLTRIAALCPCDLSVAGTWGDEAVTVTPETTETSAVCAAENLVEELCDSFNDGASESAWRLTKGWLKADTFAAHAAFQSRVNATLKMWEAGE